jgi:hypothetical protein
VNAIIVKFVGVLQVNSSHNGLSGVLKDFSCCVRPDPLGFFKTSIFPGFFSNPCFFACLCDRCKQDKVKVTLMKLSICAKHEEI